MPTKLYCNQLNFLLVERSKLDRKLAPAGNISEYMCKVMDT